MSVKQLKDYLYDQNKEQRRSGGISGDVSIFEVFKWYVAKEKAIYHALNMFMPYKQVFIGYLWVCQDKEAMLNDKLSEFSETELRKYRAPEGTKGPMKPTSFKSNEVLEFHQATVDMYKYATHGEINPAIFQIVTFPFLYGVMYGDYGHGAVFLLLGIVLCLMEPKLKNNPSMAGILKTRYFWLMMGFFACYMGMIYNEFFAIPQDWFGSCYDIDSYNPTQLQADGKQLRIAPKAGDPQLGDKHTHKDHCVYPFGLDPAWRWTTNSLTFTNNIKEKLSVIIAYFHLNFGIVLNALNAIHFGEYKKLIFDIGTGIFIFLGLIGYMIVLIYAKWWYPVWAYDDPPAP